MQLPEGLPCARARCSEKPYFGKANLESRVIYFPISPAYICPKCRTPRRGAMSAGPSLKAAPELSCTPKRELGLRGRLCDSTTCRPPGSVRTARTLLPAPLPCQGLTRPHAHRGDQPAGSARLRPSRVQTTPATTQPWQERTGSLSVWSPWWPGLWY